VQLFFKFAIALLLEDVGLPRFVDLEGFVEVGADDFKHGGGISFYLFSSNQSSAYGGSSPASFS